MTFIQKETNLLTALKKSNFAPFHGDSENAYEAVDKMITTLISTTATIAKANTRTVLEQKTANPDEPVHIDNTKDIAETITAINQLNDLCDKLNIKRIIDVNTNNPKKVVAFCNNLTKELFEMRTNRKID